MRITKNMWCWIFPAYNHHILQRLVHFYGTSCNAMASNGMETHVHHMTAPADCQIDFLRFNSTRGMASYMKPPKKRASSYVSRSAAVRDSIGVPHIDLIGSTSWIHLLNGRTERYYLSCHTFSSRRESEWPEPPLKRSLALASVATREKTRVRLPFSKTYGSPLFWRAL